jgi:hypothetical protein
MWWRWSHHAIEYTMICSAGTAATDAAGAYRDPDDTVAHRYGNIDGATWYFARDEGAGSLHLTVGAPPVGRYAEPFITAWGHRSEPEQEERLE